MKTQIVFFKFVNCATIEKIGQMALEAAGSDELLVAISNFRDSLEKALKTNITFTQRETK